MGKVLLLLAIAGTIWWLWRKSRARPRPEVRPPPRPAELMAVCAHCGVNQPRSECIESRGQVYCSEAHRQAAEHAGAGRD